MVERVDEEATDGDEMAYRRLMFLDQTLQSMIQRFGRVNRYGQRTDTRITMVHPARFDPKDKLASAREATLKLLQQLNRDASPKAVSDLMTSLTEKQREAAFAPLPMIP